jgi:hypothetical protein
VQYNVLLVGSENDIEGHAENENKILSFIVL